MFISIHDIAWIQSFVKKDAVENDIICFIVRTIAKYNYLCSI